MESVDSEVEQAVVRLLQLNDVVVDYLKLVKRRSMAGLKVYVSASYGLLIKVLIPNQVP